jgi:hypothetical protein
MKSIKKAAIIAGASSENYMFIAVLIESSHSPFEIHEKFKHVNIYG